jgi:hypothetical protein
MLLDFAITRQISDYHYAGRNSYPHSQTFADPGIEFADGSHQRKPGAHRPLGIVLMRLGIAKIGQHTIAHVLGNEATGPGNDIRATPVIGTEDFPHVFGVESLRQGSRADEIAKHDGELTSVRVIAWHVRGRDWRYRNGAVAKLGDSAQHFAAMPKQDAKILEILVREIAKDRAIDTILGKELDILGQAE